MADVTTGLELTVLARIDALTAERDAEEARADRAEAERDALADWVLGADHHPGCSGTFPGHRCKCHRDDLEAILDAYVDRVTGGVEPLRRAVPPVGGHDPILLEVVRHEGSGRRAPGGLVTAGVQAAIRCEHDGCQAYHRGPHWHPASDPGQAVLEARMSAQANGWATRRSHGGRDLCPAHRIEAAA